MQFIQALTRTRIITQKAAFGFIFLLPVLFFSCKKSNDGSPPFELKNTAWWGEFQYTTGTSTGLQVFSLEINADSTATWSDVGSTRPAGKWKMQGDMVTITLPDKSTIVATVAADKWTNFVIASTSGFQISSLSKTTIPPASVFNNTSWSGGINGKIFKLKFLDAGKIEMITGTATAMPTTWTIAGAGIRFGYSLGLGLSIDNYYATLQPGNNQLKGIELYQSVSIFGNVSFSNTWNVTKQ